MPREKSPAASTTRKRAARNPAAMANTANTANKLTVAHFVGPEQRADLIAEAAFFRAEKRGFAPGHEVEDWLAAESEVDAKLLRTVESGPRV
ncbi:MAG: DUF2934 domain-containing protein [Pseudomonadota bacterium]